jgi:uncharacterized protein (DUF697 family)/tellurite resistance protein
MEQEQSAILMVVVMAALCDGQQHESERRAIHELTTGDDADVAAVVKTVEAGRANLADITRSIVTPANRQLAYEAATAVCNADGVSNATETAFLQSLREALKLDANAATVQAAATAIAATPLSLSLPASLPAVSSGATRAAPDVAAIDKDILNAAVLNGALELLPETLASLAILPLQMKLVYRVAKGYGFDLGREHARDFIATLGVGLTAQFLEGFARKLLGGLLGGAGRQAASSGMAFVSTYAIGQVAKRYYASGRKLDTAQLRETYQSMLGEAKSLATRAQGEIRTRASSLNLASLTDLLKSN